MNYLYAIVNGDEEEIWPFRYHKYEDAEEIAKERRRTIPSAEVIEIQTKKLGEKKCGR